MDVPQKEVSIQNTKCDDDRTDLYLLIMTIIVTTSGMIGFQISTSRGRL